MEAGTLAITMAGFGNRFRDAGFTVPKYRIPAIGRPLFDWSMLSLSAFREEGWRFSFAVRRDDESEGFIRDRCQAQGIPVGTLIELDHPTDGQATTAKFLAEAADPDLPFAIYNIDTFVRPQAMSPRRIPSGCNGWIPCFPGPGDGWSFARLGQNGEVVEMREKTRISPHATVGFYWFSTARSYIETYDRHFAEASSEKGERYIAPMYNDMIARGLDVQISELALGDVGMLGTPAQVEAFIADPPQSAFTMAG